MKRIILGLLPLCAVAGAVSLAPVPPYPRSPVIREMIWHWDTDTNAAIGSDLWPITWGPDEAPTG